MIEDREERYRRAVKQVKDQRDWYTHLFVFVIVNIGAQLFYAGFFYKAEFLKDMPRWGRFTMPFFWGLSLLIHYFYSFKPSLWRHNFLKRWEQKKIEEFMRKDEEEYASRLRK